MGCRYRYTYIYITLLHNVFKRLYGFRVFKLTIIRITSLTLSPHSLILSRYYKQTWTSRTCYNLDQWFIWHRTFMMITWGLTIAGFILILLEVQGITQTLYHNPHAFIGFVTVGLCFIQPFLALMRCSPNDSMRPLFNWVHWFIGRSSFTLSPSVLTFLFTGNSAQILALVAIFYAVDLTKAELPRPQTDWLLVAFVAFHFLTHLVLSAISCLQEQNKMYRPVQISTANI